MADTLINSFTDQISWMQYLDFFIRIAVACLCGAAIGFERARRLKGAGMRTHVIVCAASALIMIVSKYAFVDLSGASGVLFDAREVDPARIAAQVISGISFIGAGVIFKNSGTIKGLTTAAGIWATAGIGLAVGAGMYAVGVFSTVVIMTIQFITHKFTIGTDSYCLGKIEFIVKDNLAYGDAFLKKADEWKMVIDQIKITEAEDGSASYEASVRIPLKLKTETIVRYFHDEESIRTFSVMPEM